MDFTYYLSLFVCLQHGSLEGKGGLGRKIKGRNKEDTEGLHNNNYNYKSHFIITVILNYKETQMQF